MEQARLHCPHMGFSAHLFCCRGYNPGRQQKGHAVTPSPLPPLGCGEESEKKRQNSWVGIRAVQQNAKKANSNNNNADKTNIQKQGNMQSNFLSLPDAPHAPQLRFTSLQPAAPARNPAWRHMVSNTLFVWPAWVSSPGWVTSWLLVKTNPVLAEPRTLSTPYSLPSTSCPGPPFSI